jgi:site-specific recombinase XerD
MSSKHILVPVMPADALDPVSAVHRLLKAVLGGRKPETITAYRQDLEDFQAFIQAPSLEQAAGLLQARGQGEANALALDYKAHLMDRKLAANTINRRLTALRNFVKLGTLGLILIDPLDAGNRGSEGGILS